MSLPLMSFLFFLVSVLVCNAFQQGGSFSGKQSDIMQPRGRISVKERMKNETSFERGKAALYCDIFGDPIPRFRWFKDGKLLKKVIRGKLKIKQELWGSLLKLENLDTSDAGWYSCLAENKFGVANTTAYLRILPPNDNFRSNLLPKLPKKEADHPKGFCQPFQSSVCGKYLVGQDVYVTHELLQSEKEKEISMFVASASDYAAAFVDSVCLGAIMKATCYYNFPLCVLREGGDTVVAKTLCRKQCHSLVNERCRQDFEQLQWNLNPRFSRIFLNCSLLPEDISDGPDRCLTLGKVLTVPSKKPKTSSAESKNCFNETGRSYVGRTDTTWTGRKCLPWKQIYGFGLTESHNYCRNPDPDKWHMKSPWCFVSLNGDKELCDVPRCQGNSSEQEEQSNEYLPIFVSLGILTGLSILFLIICCFFRRGPSPQAGYFGIKKGVLQRPLTTQLQSAFTKITIDSQELAINHIRFGDELGHGQFGPVYSGELTGLYGSASITSVAIKTLISSPSNQMQTDFRLEGQAQARIHHPYLVGLLGVCLKHSPTCLVFEMPPLGDLHEYLVYHNPVFTSMDASGVFSLGTGVAYKDLLHIATQLASAMEYLANNNHVHRDIAARNVLLGDNLLCKISDLGLVRRVYEEDYYVVQGNARLPIRWMPPEAILYGKMTVESDVWAYGVLLWEVWSLGLQPYYGYSNSEVIELVRARQMLPGPEDCPPQVYALMVECWNELPQHRPLSRDIHSRLRGWHTEVMVTSDSARSMSGQTCSSFTSMVKTVYNKSNINNNNGVSQRTSSSPPDSSFSAESTSHQSSSKTVIPGMMLLPNSNTLFIPEPSSQSTHIL